MSTSKIDRTLLQQLVGNIKKQKVTLLLGARRVGKTALLEMLQALYKAETIWLNGEDALIAELLAERSVSNYKRLIGKHQILIIDEAQFIPDIAQKAKLMIDTIQPLHIVLTGSTAFELEPSAAPLTGRTLTHYLFPLSQVEWQAIENALETRENFTNRLVFGSYPELHALSNKTDKIIYLNELVNTYLLKDLLIFENIKNAQALKDLLKLLAFQVGSEVSPSELGRQLSMSKNTVERYLGLLEKSFIIFSLSGYSNNLRKEITKNHKYYFWDNGIRNALLQDFSDASFRRDMGALWEQYFIQERKKLTSYKAHLCTHYFWRTYDQQELDFVEVHQGQLTAFECKWTPKNSRPPTAFAKAYPQANFVELSPKNYLDYIL